MKVQLWNDAIMMGLIEKEVADKMVAEGKAKYFTDQSIQLVAAKVRCSHCGYEWTPRESKPKQCPRCKRYLPWKEGEE